ncbi:MAG: sugar ABC transporter permease [Planctomycetota bacterium]|nr:sugar ABC transporter permease [Planctomycetota bacterium]
MGTRTHHPLTPLAFLLPAALPLGVFFGFAAVQVLAYSFTRYSAFTPATFVGADNYRELLDTGIFYSALINSLAYLLVTPPLVLLSLLAALIVDAKLRWMGWLRLALFLPVITPTIVGSLAWRLVLDENSGILNGFLASIGAGPVPWLSERPWTLVSAMLVTLWKGFGFYMMVFLAGLLAVPTELREAAAIDGAGRLGSFLNVTLPALRPSIILVTVVSSISALKVFEELFVTIKGTPLSHQTVMPLIYHLAFERGQFGLASAAGVLLFVLILVLSLANIGLSSRKGAR